MGFFRRRFKHKKKDGVVVHSSSQGVEVEAVVREQQTAVQVGRSIQSIAAQANALSSRVPTDELEEEEEDTVPQSQPQSIKPPVIRGATIAQKTAWLEQDAFSREPAETSKSTVSLSKLQYWQERALQAEAANKSPVPSGVQKKAQWLQAAFSPMGGGNMMPDSPEDENENTQDTTERSADTDAAVATTATATLEYQDVSDDFNSAAYQVWHDKGLLPWKPRSHKQAQGAYARTASVTASSLEKDMQQESTRAVFEDKAKETVNAPPAAAATPTKVLLLYSSESLSRETVVHQQKALVVLNANGIKFDTLDGADPECLDQRNKLFELSDLRGQYPQFFLVDSDDSTVFWGDWERFSAAVENKSVVQEFADAAAAITAVHRPEPDSPGANDKPHPEIDMPPVPDKAASPTSSESSMKLQNLSLDTSGSMVFEDVQDSDEYNEDDQNLLDTLNQSANDATTTRTCNGCGMDADFCTDGLRPCDQCGKVYYCSLHCADFDWNRGGHSKVCVAVVSEETSEDNAVGDSVEEVAVDRYEVPATVASEVHESSETVPPEVREEPDEAEEMPVAVQHQEPTESAASEPVNAADLAEDVVDGMEAARSVPADTPAAESDKEPTESTPSEPVNADDLAENIGIVDEATCAITEDAPAAESDKEPRNAKEVPSWDEFHKKEPEAPLVVSDTKEPYGAAEDEVTDDTDEAHDVEAPVTSKKAESLDVPEDEDVPGQVADADGVDVSETNDLVENEGVTPDEPVATEPETCEAVSVEVAPEADLKDNEPPTVAIANRETDVSSSEDQPKIPVEPVATMATDEYSSDGSNSSVEDAPSDQNAPSDIQFEVDNLVVAPVESDLSMVVNIGESPKDEGGRETDESKRLEAPAAGIVASVIARSEAATEASPSWSRPSSPIRKTMSRDSADSEVFSSSPARSVTASESDVPRVIARDDPFLSAYRVWHKKGLLKWSPDPVEPAAAKSEPKGVYEHSKSVTILALAKEQDKEPMDDAMVADVGETGSCEVMDGKDEPEATKSEPTGVYQHSDSAAVLPLAKEQAKDELMDDAMAADGGETGSREVMDVIEGPTQVEAPTDVARDNRELEVSDEVLVTDAAQVNEEPEVSDEAIVTEAVEETKSKQTESVEAAETVNEPVAAAKGMVEEPVVVANGVQVPMAELVTEEKGDPVEQHVPESPGGDKKAMEAVEMVGNVGATGAQHESEAQAVAENVPPETSEPSTARELFPADEKMPYDEPTASMVDPNISKATTASKEVLKTHSRDDTETSTTDALTESIREIVVQTTPSWDEDDSMLHLDEAERAVSVGAPEFEDDGSTVLTMTPTTRSSPFKLSREAPVLSWFGLVNDDRPSPRRLLAPNSAPPKISVAQLSSPPVSDRVAQPSTPPAVSDRVAAYKWYVDAHKDYVKNRRSPQAAMSRKTALDRLEAVKTPTHTAVDKTVQTQ